MTQFRDVHIAGRAIGPRHLPYVIAGLAANHGGDIERAFRIVHLAKESGADAVSFQAGPPTPADWLPNLAAEARRVGITPLCAPFDTEGADRFAALDVPACRISSLALTDLELVRRCAATGRPLIMSVGLAGIRAVADAIATAREAGAGGIVVLKRTGTHPARPEDLNLATIPDMVTRFGVPAGFSDHTLGTDAAVAAVAHGAVVVEKHVIDRPEPPTPDSAFAATPEQLRALVAGCRTAFAAHGQVVYGTATGEAAARRHSPVEVVLAPLGPDDVSDEYVAWLNDPEVVQFTEVRPGANDRASVEAYVRQMAASTKDRTFAIRADGRHVGNIKLSSISREHGTARVALLIGRRDLWGCGVATRAIEAICREGFETLGLRKLIAGVYAGNHGSIRAFERAGFAIEAVLRANRVFHGRPIDEFLLARFRQDAP